MLIIYTPVKRTILACYNVMLVATHTIMKGVILACSCVYSSQGSDPTVMQLFFMCITVLEAILVH